MNSDKHIIHPALIIYDRLGCTYVRRRPTLVRDPKTPKQQLQRQMIALAVATAKLYADQLDSRWHYYARLHHQTGLNLLVGQILRRAITTDPDTGEPVVDATQINLQAPWR